MAHMRSLEVPSRCFWGEAPWRGYGPAGTETLLRAGSLEALTARNWAVFCGKGMAGKGSQATRGSWGGRERIPAEASGLGWQEARWEGM